MAMSKKDTDNLKKTNILFDSLKCFVMKKSYILQLQHSFQIKSMFQGHQLRYVKKSSPWNSILSTLKVS